MTIFGIGGLLLFYIPCMSANALNNSNFLIFSLSTVVLQTASKIETFERAKIAANNSDWTAAITLTDKALLKLENNRDKRRLLEIYYLQLKIYQNTGNAKSSFSVIKKMEILAASLSDNDLITRVYRTLAIAYQSVRRYEIARDYYIVSIEAARISARSNILLNLLAEFGYINSLLKDLSTAKHAYSEAYLLAEKISKPKLMLNMRINHVRVLILLREKKPLKFLLADIYKLFSTLNDTQFKANVSLKIGSIYRDAQIQFSRPIAWREKSLQYFLIAKSIATENNWLDINSYALGYLAQLYSDEANYTATITLSEKALALARKLKQPALVLKWQLQLARSYNAINSMDLAEKYYSLAINSVNLLVSQVGYTVSEKVENSIELLFKEYQTILLNKLPSEIEKPIYQNELKFIVNILTQYRIWRINTDCINECNIALNDKILPVLKNHRLLIMPIILQTQIKLVTLKEGKLSLYTIVIPIDELRKKINAYQQNIYLDDIKLRPHLENFYSWFIEPVLEGHNYYKNGDTDIKHISIMYSDLLSEISMAALLNKKTGKFLIEKYAIDYVMTPFDMVNIGENSEISTILKIDTNNFEKDYISEFSSANIINVDLSMIFKSDYRDSQIIVNEMPNSINSILFRDTDRLSEILYVLPKIVTNSYQVLFKNLNVYHFTKILVNTTITNEYLEGEKNNDKNIEFLSSLLTKASLAGDAVTALQQSSIIEIKHNKNISKSNWFNYRLMHQSSLYSH